MKVVFSKTAEKQFHYWKKKDPNTYQRILNLLKAIASDPFKGIRETRTVETSVSRLLDQTHQP